MLGTPNAIDIQSRPSHGPWRWLMWPPKTTKVLRIMTLWLYCPVPAYHASSVSLTMYQNLLSHTVHHGYGTNCGLSSLWRLRPTLLNDLPVVLEGAMVRFQHAHNSLSDTLERFGGRTHRPPRSIFRVGLKDPAVAGWAIGLPLCGQVAPG